MNLHELGTLRKPHGLKGWMRLEIEETYLTDVQQSEVLFVQMKGQPVPYFIEGVEDKALLLIKLEEVDTKEAASQLNGKTCYLRESDLSPKAQTIVAETKGLELLIGFTLVDQSLGALGIIEELVELPMQQLALIRRAGKEVLIPLHASLIVSVDEAHKVLEMDLPEGLV
ncbi:MAG: ribosome maturation factor RimM [Bacteroidota bacterium]